MKKSKKTPNSRRSRRGAPRLLRDQRGQSLVSYSIITAAILGGLTAMSFVILPRLIGALNSYTQSLYFCINLPFP